MLYYTKRGLLLAGVELFDTEISVPEDGKELASMWTSVLGDLVIQDFIKTNDVRDNKWLSNFDLQESLEGRFGGSLKANYSDLQDWVREAWSVEYLRSFIVDINKRW